MPMDQQSIFEIARASVFAGVLVSLVIFGGRWIKSRQRSVFQKIAQEQGFEILNWEEKLFSSGPFGWGTCGRASVFRLKVRDRDRRERFIWIRCGSFWTSFPFDGTTEIRWENE